MRQHCGPSISGSPPTAMHRLCVPIYVARGLHPHECMHRMLLLYPDRICAEARLGPPSRSVLLMHRMSALSHDSHLYLFHPPSRSVIHIPAMQSLMCSFVVRHSLAVHRTETVAAVVCCIACTHHPVPPISIYFVPSPDL